MFQALTTNTDLNRPVIHPNAYLLRSPIVASLDRQLGYFGAARFVIFTYDARTESVLWNDGESSGYGSGAWRPYVDHVEPLARQLEINLTGKSGSYVLLIDRSAQKAYFTRHDRAEVLIRNQDRRVIVSAAYFGALSAGDF